MVTCAKGSVKGSPQDKQPFGPCIKGSPKLSQRVTLTLYTGKVMSSVVFVCLFWECKGLCTTPPSAQYLALDPSV